MKDSYIVALGNFDGVHKGHKKLIESVKELATKNGVRSAVFTFINDIDGLIGKTDGLIYTGEEKLSVLSGLNTDAIISITADKDFLSKTPTEFLDYLNGYGVIGYVVGKDYRFGCNASGNVNTLEWYCQKNGKQLFVKDYLLYKGEKISSTRIKALLKEGNIEEANEMLSTPYFIKGLVVNDRKVGSKIGFPTANMVIPEEKFQIKHGVYKGRVKIDGKTYNCAVNYGGRPTFFIDGISIEIHIIGFNGELYGEDLKVELLNYIRPIKKFERVEELIKQIQEDVKRCI